MRTTLVFLTVLFLLVSTGLVAQNVGIGTTTPAYKLDVVGEVTARTANAFRLRQNSYSVFHRNDNTNYYILLTNDGTPDANWNTLRPLIINNATGDVRIGGTNTLYTNHANRMVGIGTLTPRERLEVNGNIRIPAGYGQINLGNNLFINGQGPTGRISNNAFVAPGGWQLADTSSNGATIELRDNGKIELYGTATSGQTNWRRMFGVDAPANVAYFPSGSVGIGTINPVAKLDVQGTARVNYMDIDPQNTVNEGGEIRLRGSDVNPNWQIDNHAGYFRLHTGGAERFIMSTDGRLSLGAGRVFPGLYKLYVRGGILAEQVKVAMYNTGEWSDYVFADDYDLKSLPEVEKFVIENKHLPNVPSAVEMVQQGNDLGKTDAILLEKIEELYLHMIEMDKQMKETVQQKDELEQTDTILQEKIKAMHLDMMEMNKRMKILEEQNKALQSENKQLKKSNKH